MRPGRPADLDLLLRRFSADAALGRRDFVSPAWLSNMLADFDWDTRCRVVDSGEEEGMVLVMDRHTVAGTVTRIEASSSTGELASLLEWGLLLSHATGAVAAQVWRRRGSGDLQGLGMEFRRPFWRMDRPDLEAIPEPPAVPGYRVVTQETEAHPMEVWAELYNRSFSQHFNHSPETAEEFQKRHGRNPDLLLMAVAGDGEPAALVLGGVDDLMAGDRRLSPLGMVGVVGTLPEHRRRGLGLLLTAESLRRLKARGAASASLYVDGQNADRAYDIYRRLGFEIGVETEVWEKRF